MNKTVPGLSQETLDWLLDPDDPGVHYLALKDLLKLAADDPELAEAQRRAHEEGPIARILARMHPDGYWVKPGPGYGPKYKSIVWSLVLLSQLGARAESDGRIRDACSYLLEHALASGGQFSYNGMPSGTFDCLQGNLCTALLDLGYDDPRLERAFDWMARTVTGEGLEPAKNRKAELRYSAYKCGPNFACGANNRLPCAWGAAKVMLAFAKLPVEQRTPEIERAIQQGVDFLFSIDPAEATYPSGMAPKPSGNWWKFGFPVYYVTDILQIVEALALLGYRQDPRLKNALDLVRSKQDKDGRWVLEYDYTGKTWGSYGKKQTPNKWVTLRALRALG